MKTDKEWGDEILLGAAEWAEFRAKIREIQADALRHAARECRRRITPLKVEAYNVACEECATFIEADEARAMNDPR